MAENPPNLPEEDTGAALKPKTAPTGIVAFFEGIADYLQQTIGDPKIREVMLAEMGVDTARPEIPSDDSSFSNAMASLADPDRQRADEATFATLVTELEELIEIFANLGKAMSEQENADWDVVYWFIRLMTTNWLRVRYPPLYAAARAAEIVIDEFETVRQLEPAMLINAVHGEGLTGGERVMNNWLAIPGFTMTLLDALLDTFGAVIDAHYGWDPDPQIVDSSQKAADLVSQRVLTVIIRDPRTVGARLMITMVPVEGAPGPGPGLFLSFGGELTLDAGAGTLSAVVTNGLDVFIPLDDEAHDFELTAGAPGAYVLFDVQREPKHAGPAFVLGDPDETRIELGAVSYGCEVRSDGLGVRFEIEDGKLIIVTGGDSFLREIVGEQIEIGFDVGIAYDPQNGLRLDGGTRVGVTVPVKTSLLGFLTIHHLTLELGSGSEGYDVGLSVTAAISANIGPFRATVEHMGLMFEFALGVDKQPPPRLGFMDVDVAFEPPTGIGLGLDAGIVKGGGYVDLDPDSGEYTGALELKIGPLSVKAIALLSTRMPDGGDGWSLLLLVYAQFTPIQLSFGFTLDGVGGMIGLQHAMDVQALMDGLSTGVMDDILFPKDPVGDAPRIIKNLKVVFPQTPRAFVIGLMVQLGWGTPKLIDIRVGVMLQLDNAIGGEPSFAPSRIVVVGQLRIDQSAAGLVLLRLLADILVNFDLNAGRFTLVARLRDSVVGGFTVSGMLVVAAGATPAPKPATGAELAAGDDPTPRDPPAFLLAAGGFHPSFTNLPPGLPAKIDRVGVSIKQGPLTIALSAYFAVTSGSVQLGAEIKITAKLGPIELKGWLGFDALFEFDPEITFRLELKAGVTLSFDGEVLASVELSLSLTGPGEWHAWGTATFKFLFWDIEAPFDVTWGVPASIEEALTNIGILVKAVLGDVVSWSAALPIGGESVATLAPVAAAEGELLAHPLGALSVSQRIAPFGLQIEKYGNHGVEGARQFSVTSVTIGDKPAGGARAVTEFFAPGQFLELTEDEKLSKPSFERFTAGVSVASDVYRTPAYADPAKPVVSAIAFETSYLEPKTVGSPGWQKRGFGTSDQGFELAGDPAPRALSFSALEWQSKLGAAGRSPLRDGPRLRPEDSPRVAIDAPALAIVDTGSLAAVAGGVLEGAAGRSQALASQQARAIAVDCQVVEAYELAGMP